MEPSGEKQEASLEKILLDKFRSFNLDKEVYTVAEKLREHAIEEIKNSGDMCGEKQELMRSIKIRPGRRSNEYLVVSEGDYGKDLEFGTRNSLESPWFIPAFVTLAGSIHNCLQGALKRAFQRARRHHIRR
jgi:hypothetical protein